MREAQAQLIHDLRNAATVLRAAAAQLRHEDRGDPADVVEQLLEIIGRRSDLVLGLLDELSALHEREPEQTRGVEAGWASQRVVLYEVCRDALGRRPPEGTSVALHVPDDVVVVGEPGRVVRILDNLLVNAFRYGGHHVTVTARRGGSFVSLEVHDDGPGVPCDIEAAVFDAHVRGPRSDSLGGSGLGLAIVRELCATMGGTVSYRYRAGASFTITLPAAPDSAPAAPGTLTLDDAVPWSPAGELVDALDPVATDTHLWRSRPTTGRRSAATAEPTA